MKNAIVSLFNLTHLLKCFKEAPKGLHLVNLLGILALPVGQYFQPMSIFNLSVVSVWFVLTIITNYSFCVYPSDYLENAS